MKAINFIFLILTSIYSVNCFSAFSKEELEQLRVIDNSSIKNMEMAKSKAMKSINEQIKNSPEKKQAILELKESWESTMHKKCIVNIYESLNTDAETAEMNDCLEKEYLEEKKYFDELSNNP